MNLNQAAKEGKDDRGRGRRYRELYCSPYGPWRIDEGDQVLKTTVVSKPRASLSLDVNYRTKEGEKDGEMAGCAAWWWIGKARAALWCGGGGDGSGVPP